MSSTTIINAAGQQVTYDYGGRYEDSKRKDGRKVGERKGWQVAQMWESHHEIARRLILGQSNEEIAIDLNCTAQTVSNVRNSPVVQEKLAIMSAARDAGTLELAKEIADLAPLALQRVKEAIENGTVLGKELSGSIILKEANGLLDREIGKPTQRIDTRGLHGVFTLADIERIKERARELAPIPVSTLLT